MAETVFTAEPGSHEASYVAVINAPKSAVYRAYTEPDLLVRWWAPSDLGAKVETYDARTGGSWRIINVDAEGNEYAFRGVFHEVSSDRICQTWEFEGWPGSVSLQTATFEDVDGGKTRITSQVVCQSVADRDGLKDTGMESFAPVGMQQLEDVARSL